MEELTRQAPEVKLILHGVSEQENEVLIGVSEEDIALAERISSDFPYPVRFEKIETTELLFQD